MPSAPVVTSRDPPHTTRYKSDKVPEFWSDQAETDSVVAPESPLEVAVIVVVPVESELAFPFEPVALLIVAIALSDVLQVTDDVTSPR